MPKTTFLTLLLLCSCGGHQSNLSHLKKGTEYDPNPLCHLTKGKYPETLLKTLLGGDFLGLYPYKTTIPYQITQPQQRQVPIREGLPSSGGFQCSVSPEWYECQCPREDLQPRQLSPHIPLQQALKHQQGQQGQQVPQQQTDGERECLLFDRFFCF